MMFAPSASKLDLAHRCAFPWAGRVRWPPRTTSEAANYGTAVSRVAERLAHDVTPGAPDALTSPADVSDLGLSELDAKRLDHAARLLREQLEADDDAERLPELAIAYHVETGEARLLASTGQRDYSDVRDGEAVGTLDLLRLTKDGRRVVRDWKTGRYMLGVRPIASGQLRMLGLAAARLYGVDEIDIELAQVDDDGIRIARDTMDAFALGAAADELRTLWARLRAGGGVPMPGHWCADHYCPIASECPATQKALAAVDVASELRYPMSVVIESAEHAAYVRERLQAVEVAAKTIKGALEAFARTTPIPAGDGKLWGVVECTRETIDLAKPGAIEVLRARLGEFGFVAAVDCKTSKTAIHRAAVAQATKRGEAKQLEMALLDELRAAGAVRESTYTRFEEFTPKAASDGAEELPAA
ncbi:MAG: PD-(D/E)XK nuclease family protein [Gemmatimonadaceae bacterium]|jgi:hypothetical protein